MNISSFSPHALDRRFAGYFTVSLGSKVEESASCIFRFYVEIAEIAALPRRGSLRTISTTLFVVMPRTSSSFQLRRVVIPFPETFCVSSASSLRSDMHPLLSGRLSPQHGL